METIQSIRVISTRALRTESIRFAEEQGWKLEIYPMTETIFTFNQLQIAEIIDILSNFKSKTLLVFSSSNAVRALYAACNDYYLHFPSGVNACFVGKKTAGIASELLLTENVMIADYAIELVRKLADWKDYDFVFISGQKRMDTIPAFLKENGFQLKEYKVYDTLETPVKIEGDYAAALFFSPSAVDSFYKLNKPDHNMLAVSIGETTAECLRSHQVKKILMALKPGEIETLKALVLYLDENK